MIAPKQDLALKGSNQHQRYCKPNPLEECANEKEDSSPAAGKGDPGYSTSATSDKSTLLITMAYKIHAHIHVRLVKCVVLFSIIKIDYSLRSLL